jgi:D-arabinose 1-dehydrogenase-like Zn-dependent alcohol dehydrogenase
MKAAVFKQAKQPLSFEDRTMPSPGPGQVRIKIAACGLCHSDCLVADGAWPGLKFPRVPGHEVAGTVDVVGEGVTEWRPGARVGVGWYGGHDGTCAACRVGDFVLCQNGPISGISFDGGYAEYMVAPALALAPLPDGMSFVEAAPQMCAGVTTFNALRHADAHAGDLVAVHGLGGLGHLGVQFARAMGFETVAVSRGADKAELAKKLGAHHYVDTAKGDGAQQLTKLGGAKVILSTAPAAQAISQLVPGLGRDGTLLVVAAAFEPLSVGAIDLISGRRRIMGWASGTSMDSKDTLNFAARNGIKPMTEVFPLAEAQAAYTRMMSGKARFRVVLEMK